MPTATLGEVAASLQEVLAQMAELSKRIAILEKQPSQPAEKQLEEISMSAGPVSATPVSAKPPDDRITEEELVAISAAIGAYLGVRAHIRQIRLVSSSAWAQQGRASIQASHVLQG